MDIIKKLSESFTFERIILLTLGGTLVHWYDFYIVSFLLPEILGQLFSSTSSEFLFYLPMFSYLGFAIRPIGALFFSKYIDLYGRKISFSWSLSLIAFSTLICCFLPLKSFNPMIILALLILIRLLQGLSLSIEYASALTYVGEVVPKKNVGFYTGLVQATAPLGFAIALLIFMSAKFILGTYFMETIGWRITLLLGLPLIFLTIKIRNTLPESPVFEALKKTHSLSVSPIRDAFGNIKNLKKVIFALMAVSAPQGVTYYLAHVYMSSFVIQKSTIMSKVDITLILLMCSFITWPFTVIAGSLCDKYTVKKVISASMALSTIVILTILWLLYDNFFQLNFVSLTFIFCSIFICSHLIYGSSGAYLLSKFPERISATSLSIPYHLGNGLFGGGVFLLNYLFPIKDYSNLPIIIYFSFFILIGFILITFFEKKEAQENLEPLVS